MTRSVPSTLDRLRQWIRANRWPLLFAALLLLVLPMRDLWSPDEPDFAQCVREMRERGSWLLPYLNGQPYSEKPILFYWLMKLCVILGQALTGGRGFTHGVAAWALRLPSVLTAIGFVFGFRAWAAHFAKPAAADTACVMLATTPIWFWQAQAIQIDLLFAALLAGSWLAWLGGYLLLRGEAEKRSPDEESHWFLAAYPLLGLAFLAKGPLALVLSAALMLAFLAWQRDWAAFLRMRLGWGLLLLVLVVAPWYVAAGIRGGAGYAYQMIVHQNLERALKAWDHLQPWWRYAQYLLGDFFPWVLLLPALAVSIKGRQSRREPLTRFLLLAFAVPFLLLSCSQSKQGKYLLMAYPFLALLLARRLEAAAPKTARRLGWLLSGALAGPALGFLALGFFRAGGHHLQAQLAPFLGPLRLCALLLALGALLATRRAASGRIPVREAACALGLVFLVGGTWGFRLLDPHKSFRLWTARVQPLIQGRQVYNWQTIRSGVMVYTDHRMPEIHSADELEARLGPEDRLVAMDREWNQDAWGMTPEKRAAYEVLLRVDVGGGETLLLKKQDDAKGKP